MQKIASPQDLQAELHRLVAYCQSGHPSRELVASQLRGLADRVAGYHRFKVGDRVEGGDIPEDHDTGKVVKVRGAQVTVAWDSNVTTTQHASALRELDT